MERLPPLIRIKGRKYMITMANLIDYSEGKETLSYNILFLCPKGQDHMHLQQRGIVINKFEDEPKALAHYAQLLADHYGCIVYHETN